MIPVVLSVLLVVETLKRKRSREEGYDLPKSPSTSIEAASIGTSSIYRHSIGVVPPVSDSYNPDLSRAASTLTLRKDSNPLHPVRKGHTNGLKPIRRKSLPPRKYRAVKSNCKFARIQRPVSSMSLWSKLNCQSCYLTTNRVQISILISWSTYYLKRLLRTNAEQGTSDLPLLSGTKQWVTHFQTIESSFLKMEMFIK